MKIISEKPSNTFYMEIDFEEEEFDTLKTFADQNMPEEELDRVKIEWAFVNILKAEFENAKTE